jgi:hypothetical protein
MIQHEANPTKAAWTSWDLAGLTDPKSGRLERTQPNNGWKTSQTVMVKDGRLFYDPKTSDQVKGPAGVLDDLLKLRPTASDDVVADFAGKWGIVVLCEHRRPITHSRCVGATLFDEQTNSCTLLGGQRPYVPLDWYRQFARWSRSVLNIAARLHRGQPAEPEDWEAVDPEFADGDGYTYGQGWRKVPLTKAARVDEERENLASVLDRWLDITGVSVRFVWDSDRPSYCLYPGGLPGAVVMSLIFSVAKSGGFAVCSSCGRAYTPKRRPAEGRRSYCDDEQCQKASVRDAQRDLRARKREQDHDWEPTSRTWRREHRQAVRW